MKALACLILTGFACIANAMQVPGKWDIMDIAMIAFVAMQPLIIFGER